MYENLSKAAVARRWTEVSDAIDAWAMANGGPAITETKEPALRAAVVPALASQAARAEEEIKQAEKARREADAKVKAAYRDERSFIDRREQDVRAKFARQLADVDLLIIPRPTVANVAGFDRVWPPIHILGKQHVEVIKEFMKAGKPVLACLGPVSWNDGPDPLAADGLERLLAERGIELGRETIVFDTEQQGLSELVGGGLTASSRADIPPLLVVEKSADAAKPNPVAVAVQSTARSVDRRLDLRLRAPRPVYVAPGWQDRLAFSAEFLLTSPESWNEVKPFPTRDEEGDIVAVPHYEPTLKTDKKWNTREAERKEPFPVGVAIEAPPPAYWTNGDSLDRTVPLLIAGPGWNQLPVAAAAIGVTRPKGTPSRLVVFGSGNLFCGPELKPTQEKLLLHSVNWLTERSDRLPRAVPPEQEWKFPRVEMSDRDLTLWRLGTAVGLPLVAVYLGLMAMMVRRLR